MTQNKPIEEKCARAFLIILGIILINVGTGIIIDFGKDIMFLLSLTLILIGGIFVYGGLYGKK